MLFSVAASVMMPGAVMALPAMRLPGMSTKIVGGTKAQAGEFPFIVSLSQDDAHFCGGVLVGEKTVVTAAHCSVDVTADQVKVRAGTTTWAEGGDQVEVSKITVHPNYSADTMDNDIAVWTLASGIEQNNDTIKYVTLPESGFDPTANTTATVAGWGLLKSGDSDVPADLRKVNVPVVSREDCNTAYNKNDTTITKNMFCAGSTGKDSCQGDSGGPIVDSSSATLLGVVSWGFDCAAPGYPGVYANVGQYIDFINGKESGSGDDESGNGNDNGNENGNDDETGDETGEDDEESGHHHHGGHGGHGHGDHNEDDTENSDETGDETGDDEEKSGHHGHGGYSSHQARAVSYWG